jgi:hypothetical protein
MSNSFEVHYDGIINECVSINFSSDKETAIVLLRAASQQQVVLHMSRKALSTLVEKFLLEPPQEQA